MPDRREYHDHATLVVNELFPEMSAAGKAALVWLIVDALMSLDSMIER